MYPQGACNFMHAGFECHSYKIFNNQWLNEIILSVRFLIENFSIWQLQAQVGPWKRIYKWISMQYFGGVCPRWLCKMGNYKLASNVDVFELFYKIPVQCCLVDRSIVGYAQWAIWWGPERLLQEVEKILGPMQLCWFQGIHRKVMLIYHSIRKCLNMDCMTLVIFM